MSKVTRTVSVTITNGTAVSGAIALQPNEMIVGIEIPAAWTAADIGFDLSQDGSTWFQVVDSTRAAATSFFRFLNIAASTVVILPESEWLYPHGTSNLRLHSINSASNADVTQGADRICVVLIGKDM